MARTPGKRGRAKAQNELAKKLIEALKFVGVAIKNSGEDYQQAVVIRNGYMLAFNGVIGAGVHLGVDIDVNAIVNAGLLADAMANVGKELTITVMGNGALSIVSGDYAVTIPQLLAEESAVRCLPPYVAPIAPLGDAFKGAMAIAGRLVRDTAEDLLNAAIVTREDGHVIATDRQALIEAWHGFPMPSGLAMPKALATAINKVSDEITGFGFTHNQLAIWFGEGRFIVSQLYGEGYPIDQAKLSEYIPKFFDGANLGPTPKGLFDAIKAVEPFARNGFVSFTGGDVVTDSGDKKHIAKLPEGGKFATKYLMLLPEAEKVDLGGDRNMAVLVAPTARMAIAGWVDKKPEPEPEPALEQGEWGPVSDEIPY